MSTKSVERQYSMKEPAWTGLIAGCILAFLMIIAGKDASYVEKIVPMTLFFSGIAFILCCGYLMRNEEDSPSIDGERPWETWPALTASMLLALLFGVAFWLTSSACYPVKMWLIAMVNT